MRKKAKLKPSSEALKVLNVIKQDPRASTKELTEKTGLSKTQVYTTKHYLKKRGLLGSAKPKADQNNVSQELVKKAVVKLNQDIQQRDQQIAGLSGELNRIRHLYMDQLAVVRYLEAKIVDLVEANLMDKD